MAGTQQGALRVFLCHASADEPDVRALYKRLMTDGIEAWLDQENLIPGQNWQVEIPKAVRSSDVVIVCLSRNSVNKEGYVQKEIRFALDIADEKPEGTIFIIPAKLEDCDVPNRLGMYQWVDLFSKDGYERLLRTLGLRANQLGRRLPNRKVFSSFLSRPVQADKKEDSLDQSSKAGQIPGQGHTVSGKESQNRQKPVAPRKSKTFFMAGFISFLALILVLIFGLPPLFDSFGPESTLTPTRDFTVQQGLKTATDIVPEPTATVALAPTHSVMLTTIPTKISTLNPVLRRTPTSTATPSSTSTTVPSPTPTSEFLLIVPEYGGYANLYSEPCDWASYAMGGGEILTRVRDGTLVRDLHTYSSCYHLYKGTQMVYVSIYAGNKEYKGWIRGVNVKAP